MGQTRVWTYAPSKWQLAKKGRWRNINNRSVKRRRVKLETSWNSNMMMMLRWMKKTHAFWQGMIWYSIGPTVLTTEVHALGLSTDSTRGHAIECCKCCELTFTFIYSIMENIRDFFRRCRKIKHGVTLVLHAMWYIPHADLSRYSDVLRETQL